MESKNSEELEEESADRADALKKELAAERKRNEDLLNRLRYAQADLENYRKRMDRELIEAGESMARSLVMKLLIVVDELDLAVRHSKGKKNPEVGEGIEMVQKNLWSALSSAGVERIQSVGEPFDPSIHEAVEKLPGRSNKQDMVVEEVRPGFRFRGQLLRPSMVKVELASEPAGKEAEADE